jgi:hypothetical protein
MGGIHATSRTFDTLAHAGSSLDTSMRGRDLQDSHRAALRPGRNELAAASPRPELGSFGQTR